MKWCHTYIQSNSLELCHGYTALRSESLECYHAIALAKLRKSLLVLFYVTSKLRAISGV
jgi:hypothetical protein